MAPIRRYLRITKYSVLEVRIYLVKPSDASWLLSSRDNVLQRIIQAVRPTVLPKLREENENARGKKGGGSKKKQRSIKDVASGEDFEVAIFLKETSTRHSLLTKKKDFADGKGRLRSNGKGLTGWLVDAGAGKENAIRVDEDEDAPAPAGLRLEDDEEVVELRDIPEALQSNSGKKRKSATVHTGNGAEDQDEGLFVSSSDEEFFATQKTNPSKKRKKKGVVDERTANSLEVTELQDDKKKMLLNTSYEGFSIYGRILCLIVTRTGKRDMVSTATAPVGGSQMMEEWIGTQAAHEAGIHDDEDG